MGKCESRSGKSLKSGEGGFGGSDNSKTVYEIEKKLGWCNHKLIFLVHQPSFFFIFDDILEILLPPVKQKTLYFNFIMVFSRGQNGKGFEKIKQIGKLKKNGFSNRKLGTKNKKHPSFNKERLIVPNALRKRVAASHHHELRSPQKRTKLEERATMGQSKYFTELKDIRAFFTKESKLNVSLPLLARRLDQVYRNFRAAALKKTGVKVIDDSAFLKWSGLRAREPFELLMKQINQHQARFPPLMPVTASKLTSHSSDIRLKEIKVSPIHEMDYLFSATHGDGPPLSPLSASLQPKVPAVYAIQPPILKAGDDTGTSYHDNVRLDALLLAHTQHRIKKHNFYCPVFLKTIHIVLKIFWLFYSLSIYICINNPIFIFIYQPRKYYLPRCGIIIICSHAIRVCYNVIIMWQHNSIASCHISVAS